MTVKSNKDLIIQSMQQMHDRNLYTLKASAQWSAAPSFDLPALLGGEGERGIVAV